MKTLIVIPARFGSTRFEGKPLVEIEGISLIKRTYLQAKKINFDADIIVATDNQKIFDHVMAFGQCEMTSLTHESGTDRCFEVLEKQKLHYDFLINLQGDEPFIAPQQIEQLRTALLKNDISTLIKKIDTNEDLQSPNVVKVVFNKKQEALYFSRQAIPFFRGQATENWATLHEYYRHIGIYGFRTSVIKDLKTLKNSALEKAESLEQLRWLENGFHIKLEKTNFASPAIDSPEDLEKAIAFLRASNIY